MEHFIDVIFSNNIIIWSILIVVITVISSIFPLLLFLIQDIVIIWAVFLAIKTHMFIYIYILILIWVILWEIINYYIWYKFWYKILQYKYIKKRIKPEIIEDIKENKLNYLILFKFTPWISLFIPILCWSMKVKFFKFIIIDIITYSIIISCIYWFWIFGLNIFN